MLLEKICRELGVGVGAKWLGNDGYYYKITNEGLIGFYYPTSDDEENFDVDNELWANIMRGELKPKWKPEKGDYFWIVDFIEEDKVCEHMWHDNETENKLLKRGLVFKNKEEATKVANEMIKSLKEDK